MNEIHLDPLTMAALSNQCKDLFARADTEKQMSLGELATELLKLHPGLLKAPVAFYTLPAKTSIERG